MKDRKWTPSSIGSARRINYVPPDSRLTWQQDLVALHAISDSIIAVSYLRNRRSEFSGSCCIAFILRKRSGRWAGCSAHSCCFARVIQSAKCITLWYPLYGVQGLVKAGSALFSVVTVAFMLPLLPDLVRLPSAQQVADANERLRREIGNTRRDGARIQ